MWAAWPVIQNEISRGPSQTVKSYLVNLVLGPPGHGRWRVLMGLLTLALYVLFAMLQHMEVLLGLIDATASAWLSAYYLLGSFGFYLLVRSGWSAHISSDPSLMLWQTVHGVLAVIGAYAITGPARGAVIAILVLILAFGMFGLSTRQARLLALFSFMALALTMAWKSRTDPLRYPVSVEVVHLAFGVIVLLGVSALAMRMGGLRARLHSQKKALEASLVQIRQLATQDELTGLVNRRHMMTLMKAEQARQQRTGEAMSLALLDLDHFKRVNDSFGHAAGDMVLRAFADSAGHNLRGPDVLSRWGGEEFLLMLPATSEADAFQCVERMRAGLAQVSVDAIAPDLRITFSAGLCACQPGESLDVAIERADQAMYRAKEQGRNCTVCG